VETKISGRSTEFYGISNLHPFSSLKSQAKRRRQTARDHEEFKHAKQKNSEKVDDTFGFDDLFCARLGGRPEEDQRANGRQTRSASENCPNSKTSPGSGKPASSAVAATAAGSGQTFGWNWETRRGYSET